MKRQNETIKLKAGQVAAVLELESKQLQNIVNAGYVLRSVQKKGRGSVRFYSFADVVRLRLFDILVKSYGLEQVRAARCVREVRSGGDALRSRYLEIEPSPGRMTKDVNLPPIRLPLAEIANDLHERVARMMETYSEGQRGRPAGWSKDMKQVLLEASDSLQGVTDEQIAEAVKASRAARDKRRRRQLVGEKA